MGEGKGERGRTKSDNASGQRGTMACAVILCRAGRCSGDMGAVDADTDTAARGEMRLCSRAPAVSAHRADGRASRVRIRSSRFVRTFLEGISFRTEILTVSETPEVGGTQPRRGLARPERRELS